MISYPFPPNASAGAVRSERFARYLPQFGWEVDVVTIKPRRDLFQEKSRSDSLGVGVKVHYTHTLDPWLWLRDRIPSCIFLKAARRVLMKLLSFPDHMLLWVPFALIKGLKICRHAQVDAIYTTSPPHSSHFTGLAICGITRKPWIADFRDPWTLNPYHEKALSGSSFLRMERLLEETILESASAILTNTRANRKNRLESFQRLSADRVIHLPNGWEEFPAQCSHIKENGPLTIVHAGSFYPRFEPYALLYALADWRNGKHPPDISPLKDIQVILLGSDEVETKAVVKDLGIEDIVQIKPWVAFDEARRTMQKAAILWVSLGTGKQTSTYVPSKLFEYIAAKRPILGFFPEGEAADLIRRTGTGIVFTSGQSVPVIKALRRALCDRNNKGIQYSPNEEIVFQYHIKNIVARFATILNSLRVKEDKNAS